MLNRSLGISPIQFEATPPNLFYQVQISQLPGAGGFIPVLARMETSQARVLPVNLPVSAHPAVLLCVPGTPASSSPSPIARTGELPRHGFVLRQHNLFPFVLLQQTLPS